MVLLFVYLAVAILVSFLCSILEAVLLSITPSYIESLKQKNQVVLSKKLEILKNDIDRPLAAILSFNTIAHTVGAAGVGAQAAKVFGDEYLGVISAILTLLILVFSEIIPKTLGANYWRNLGGFTASTLRILIFLMYPLVLLSKGITRLMAKDKKEASVSRAEVSAMADLGQKEGVFLENESKMIKNLIRFRNVKVEDVMTPRTVLVSAQENEAIDLLLRNDQFLKFSRIPVYGKNSDDITGYVLKADALTQLAKNNGKLTLKEIKRKVQLISRFMTLPQTLDLLVQSREHVALVTDKYGGIVGLVTMEDILETILGMEIMDEHDSVEDMQKYARKQWEERAARLGLEPDAPLPATEADENETLPEATSEAQPPLDEYSSRAHRKW